MACNDTYQLVDVLFSVGYPRLKINNIDHEGTRTLNLWIRSPAPYPLGHMTLHDPQSNNMIINIIKLLIVFNESKDIWLFYQSYLATLER